MNLKSGKKKGALSEVLFILVALLGFVILVFTIFNNETVLRILSYIYFLVGYTFYIFSLKAKATKTSILSIVFLLYLVFVWAFSGFEYTVIVPSLSFFLIFSSFESASVVKPQEKMFNMLFFFYMAQGILLIITSFSKYAYMSIAKEVLISRDLLLGLPNPNETGMVLAYTIIGLIICLKKRKPFYVRILTIAVLGFLFYLLILTRARTSFIGVVIFIVLSFLYREKRGKLFTNKALFLVFIIYPIVFVPLYIFYSQNIANRAALFGKTLFSGRQDIYIEHLLMWTNRLFGNVSYFHLDNAHNGFLTILLNYGIVGFTMYLIHLIRSLVEIKNNKCFCNISRTGFIAILCLIFMSASESAFLVSGKFYYANFIIMIWFANYSEIGDISNNEKNIINI